MAQYVKEQIGRVREQVRDGSVFLLASGGVDSTVAAKVIGQAIGPERLHLLHIDNGLMRKHESRQVLATLASLGLDRHLHFVDASDTFLGALAGLVEPERKRKAIGDTFIDVFEREARRLGIEGHLLGQGTIYPDTIETGGTKRADVIKTHHNRVPIIRELIAQGRVVEPLADLYKVEVRELGETLGVPHEVLWRQPFPGPGLGVRLLCSTGQVDREHFEQIEPAVAEIGRRYGLETLVLPIKSVGVKADLRSYEHPVLIGGAADWDGLLEAAGTIFKSVPGVNRGLWNVGPRMPATLRPRAATVTRDRLDLLREADAIVTELMGRHRVYDEIWQCPVVFVPLELDGAGREFCIVRPIFSERGMTAAPARFPDAMVAELRDRILRLPGVSGLALDLTSKPPGTIEWE
jgi:GMP synthase (glutamine-hydrolysing)